jgi:hypothetical protein
MTIKKVLFPPVGPEEEAKLTRFLNTTGEFMDVALAVKKVTIIEVQVNAERADVVTVLSKIAAAEKKKLESANDQKPAKPEQDKAGPDTSST